MSPSQFFEVELSPLQVHLSVETYALLQKYFGIEIDKTEVENIKNGTHIIGYNSTSKLTKFEITYTPEKIKEKIVKFMEIKGIHPFDEDVKGFWVRLDGLTTSLISDSILNSERAWNSIVISMRQLAYTLIIDTYSTHIVNLLRSIIEITLRTKYSREDAQKVSFPVVNQLLQGQSREKYHELREFGFKHFWLSSRHLELVSAEDQDLEKLAASAEKVNPETNKFYQTDSFTEKMLNWIQTHMNIELQPKFKKYYSELLTINRWKEIDGQMQVRGAFILAKSIKYLHENKEISQNPINEPSTEMIQLIMKKCQEVGE
jgi:hypothetical protein